MLPSFVVWHVCHGRVLIRRTMMALDDEWDDEWDLEAIAGILGDSEEAEDYLPVAPTGASTEPPSVMAHEVSQIMQPAAWMRGINLCLNPSCQAVLPHPANQYAIANRDGAVAHLNRTTGLSWEIQPPEESNSTKRGHLRTENMTSEAPDGSTVYVFPWNGRQHRLCKDCRPPNEPLLQPRARPNAAQPTAIATTATATSTAVVNAAAAAVIGNAVMSAGATAATTITASHTATPNANRMIATVAAQPVGVAAGGGVPPMPSLYCAKVAPSSCTSTFATSSRTAYATAAAATAATAATAAATAAAAAAAAAGIGTGATPAATMASQTRWVPASAVVQAMTVLGAGHHAHGLGSSSVAATPIRAVPPPSSELEDLKSELKDQKMAFEGLKMQLSRLEEKLLSRAQREPLSAAHRAATDRCQDGIGSAAPRSTPPTRINRPRLALHTSPKPSISSRRSRVFRCPIGHALEPPQLATADDGEDLFCDGPLCSCLKPRQKRQRLELWHCSTCSDWDVCSDCAPLLPPPMTASHTRPESPS